MNYYTSTIPLPLTEKLREAGVPIDIVENFAGTGKDIALAPSYGKVFDWLIEKEIYVNAYPEKVPAVTQEYMYAYRPYVNGQIGKESERTFYWHEAAEAAIEKALTLI